MLTDQEGSVQFYLVNKSGDGVSTRTEGVRQELADKIWAICRCTYAVYVR